MKRKTTVRQKSVFLKNMQLILIDDNIGWCGIEMIDPAASQIINRISNRGGIKG